ncbi:Uncharacterized protein TCM_038613 [Theobroma cacao]|uniref:Uncharacterized protein n=1 Tax=Theobroma cacao TaxID=3641 RepID=A0A061GQG9_THECC|nr:Uncharacterized protein TCM_038613 [Theobroma cacao]
MVFGKTKSIEAQALKVFEWYEKTSTQKISMEKLIVFFSQNTREKDKEVYVRFLGSSLDILKLTSTLSIDNFKKTLASTIEICRQSCVEP